MRIRKRENITPIHVCPGDTIALYYTDERGTRTKLCEDAVGRTMRLDTAAIVEFSPSELRALGMQDGLGGVFGESLR